MKPIFDARSEWQRLRDLGQRGLAVLALFMGLGVAQADTTNFTGDFGPEFWSLSPGSGLGTVYFTNGFTELVLVSPTNAPQGTESLDGILYNSPLQGELRVGGTVSFHWEFSAGDVQTGGAAFGWLPPSEGSPTNLAIISVPGITNGGNYSSPLLSPGTTNLSFLLDTTFVGSDKALATLVVSDFQFHEQVPEPSTVALLAGGLISFVAARWRRGRGRASG
jgi:hypothetical protein